MSTKVESSREAGSKAAVRQVGSKSKGSFNAEGAEEERTLKPGEEHFEMFTDSDEKKVFRYYYRAFLDGDFFSCTALTLDECRAARETWVAEKVRAVIKKEANLKSNFQTYMPVNDFKIPEGYCDMNGIVGLLRKHKDEPETIQFIADMMEE
jgi:hypothetical protein